MKFISILMILFLSTLFVACDKNLEVANSDKRIDNTNVEEPKPEDNTSVEEPKSENSTSVAESNVAESKPEDNVSVDENKLATPKDAITYQFDLIKQGDYDTLKACCFTEKAKSGLTKEIVESAQKDSSKYTMEDLVNSIVDGEADGKKTAKIMMKNGRTLTTLVETDGKWLANTIWFKNN